MIAYETIRRITIYADAALEEKLISHCLQLGSTGYTITAARGKGEHRVVDDPLVGSAQIRIEVLVKPAVADKIMRYLQDHHLKSQAVEACVESVEVAQGGHF